MNKEKAFINMIKENEALIFKITSIYGDNSEERKDLYQEIVFQLWKSFDRFKNESKSSTWMYRVALNTGITKIRKEKKNKETTTFDSEIHSTIDFNDHVLEERSAALYASIAQLNAVEKAIVLLYLENKSHKEIAQISGLTESNVSTRLVRIKEKLKQKITKS